MSFTPGLDIAKVELPARREVSAGGSIQVTEKEFEKLKIENDKDPQAFRNAQLVANGMGAIVNAMAANPGSHGGHVDANGNVQVTQSIAPKIAASAAPKNVINNPIELPNKL